MRRLQPSFRVSGQIATTVYGVGRSSTRSKGRFNVLIGSGFSHINGKDVKTPFESFVQTNQVLRRRGYLPFGKANGREAENDHTAFVKHLRLVVRRLYSFVTNLLGFVSDYNCLREQLSPLRVKLFRLRMRLLTLRVELSVLRRQSTCPRVLNRGAKFRLCHIQCRLSANPMAYEQA